MKKDKFDLLKDEVNEIVRINKEVKKELNCISNVKEALEWFNRYTTYSFDEEEVSQYIMDALSCHDYSSADFSRYNEELETGIIFEEHCIEVSNFHTRSKNPETFYVRVKEEYIDGVGGYNYNDIEFIG